MPQDLPIAWQVGAAPSLSRTPLSDHGPTEKYLTYHSSLPQAPRLWRRKAGLPDWLTSVEMIRLSWRPQPLYSFPVFLGDLETPYGSHLQPALEEASFPHHTLLMWSGSPSPSPWGWGQGLPQHWLDFATALLWPLPFLCILLLQHLMSFNSCSPHPGDCGLDWD